MAITMGLTSCTERTRCGKLFGFRSLRNAFLFLELFRFCLCLLLFCGMKFRRLKSVMSNCSFSYNAPTVTPLIGSAPALNGRCTASWRSCISWSFRSPPPSDFEAFLPRDFLLNPLAEAGLELYGEFSSKLWLRPDRPLRIGIHCCLGPALFLETD